MLALKIALIAITFVSGVVAVCGKTWREDVSRPTKRGWLAVLCLSSILALGVLHEVWQRQEAAAETEKREKAQKEQAEVQANLRSDLTHLREVNHGMSKALDAVGHSNAALRKMLGVVPKEYSLLVRAEKCWTSVGEDNETVYVYELTDESGKPFTLMRGDTINYNLQARISALRDPAPVRVKLMNPWSEWLERGSHERYIKYDGEDINKATELHCHGASIDRLSFQIRVKTTSLR